MQIEKSTTEYMRLRKLQLYCSLNIDKREPLYHVRELA